jgi:hypothetical protein
MLTWAVDRGRLTINHVKGCRRLYHSDRSEIIWLPEHIDAFMNVAPVEIQQALILALHTGQRQGDLARTRKRRAKVKRGPLLHAHHALSMSSR